MSTHNDTYKPQPGDERLSAAVSLFSTDSHAIQRASERYGLEINSLTLRQIEGLVRAGRVGITLDTDRHLECEVILGGVRCLFVYLKRQGRVVTFLPLFTVEERYRLRGPVVKRDTTIRYSRRQGRRNHHA